MFDYTKNALLSFLAIPFLFVYIILSYGFVLTKLYGWFVFPIFPNFPQYIGILQMSGLMIFVELSTKNKGRQALVNYRMMQTR